MKLILVFAFLLAALTYGCATHYVYDPYGRYGYQEPHTYYYDYRHDPYMDPHNYYPDGYRYFHGG